MVRSKNQANSEPSGTSGFSDNLLILNYVMDPTHPALAHQVEVVEKLALKFKSVTVLTGQLNWNPTAPNIKVFSSNWRPDHNIENILRFYRVFFRVIRNNQFISVFSHMTSVQSCLVGPFLRIRKINHFLWYAHAQNSIILKFAYFWVTRLVTSTTGSCPLLGDKILYLGQSIDQAKFKTRPVPDFPLRRFIHVGRADPSKNFNLIIETISHYRKFHPDLCLEFVGSPSGSVQAVELEKLKKFWSAEITRGWLKFSPAIPRDRVPELLNKHDVFIHAFRGSLDKTAMPVCTINQEYLNEFGTWGSKPITLASEVDSLLKLGKKKLEDEVQRRTIQAIELHSSRVWIDKLEHCLRTKQFISP
jgi:glycosyltransferase involved in cell wall biosynthesis